MAKTRIDEKVLRDAASRAKKQPRLAFYSPLAASVLNYRKDMIPRYSISEELAKIVEGEISRRWRDLADKAQRLLKRPRVASSSESDHSEQPKSSDASHKRRASRSSSSARSKT